MMLLAGLLASCGGGGGTGDGGTGSASDTSAPTVTFTTPRTASGLVVLSAAASDNVGIAGVQFKIGGVNLGAEDTTAPYELQWDTVLHANGSHTLTATARDAAGNATTSAPMTVTIANLLSSPTSQPLVQFNQLEYLGAFRGPQCTGKNCLDYGAFSLAYRPAHPAIRVVHCSCLVRSPI